VGARNVWHVVGKKYGIMAGFLDVLKGFLAYGVGYFLGLLPVWIWLCGFFVVFGHDFPVFLKGRGGKGAASAMGFLLGMQPLVILASGLLIGAVYLPFRRFHLALIIGMASIPVLWWLVLEEPWPEIVLPCSFLLFLGLKRFIDEPYMRRIKQESGW
jgi:glycerol-3-phosphate acyltransferase PlsY